MTFPILGGNSAVAGGFSIDNSLRLNDDDTPKLAITPNASNRKTWTFSAWVKRSSLSSNQRILSITGTNDFLLRFRGDDKLSFIDGSITSELITATKVFRDTSAWYHIVIVLDTTQGTASNRAKLYVNGYQETDLVNNSGGSASYPSQNADGLINSNVLHTVGCRDTSGTVDQNVDGYLAEVHFIDGTAKSPTDFGEFDEDSSGIWKPIRYSGSYGTNGFKLDFSNSSNFGEDFSGNGNDFTATNLASTDQMLDTPTKNFNTLSPLAGQMRQNGHMGVLSQGNLQFTPSSDTGWSGSSSNFLIPQGSGKWYAETVITYVSNQSGLFGIQNAHDIRTHGYFTAEQYSVVWQDSGDTYIATVSSGTETNKDTSIDTSVGDIYQIAYDSDNGKIWFGRNNTWITGNPSTDTSPAYSSITGDKIIYSASYRSSSSYTAQLVNFGQDSSFAGNKTRQNNSDDNGEGDFFYAPPTGFLCLNTTNLATELSPTIDDGSAYFHTQLYTGNRSSSQTITNDANAGDFQPDWVWIKHRNDTVAYSHVLMDSSRGAGKGLATNIADAEYTSSNQITSFDTDGFSIGNGSSVNQPDRDVDYVAWQWKANGGTTSSNTDGSITSTVQANTTAGFSIVTYTGNGTDNSTIGHGLGKTPSMILLKRRSQADDWAMYHSGLTSGKEINLNYTNAEKTDVNNATWGDNYPSSIGSSTFAVGYAGDSNENSATYVAYCFAEIEGYSKFGSYTSNGNIDGPLVYTGFKPSFIIMKASNQTAEWVLQDIARDPVNPVNNRLIPNDTVVEYTNTSCLTDFVSNGFKMRSNHPSNNFSGYDFIYMAFAEHPFVSSSGVPVTAR